MNPLPQRRKFSDLDNDDEVVGVKRTKNKASKRMRPVSLTADSTCCIRRSLEGAANLEEDNTIYIVVFVIMLFLSQQQASNNGKVWFLIATVIVLLLLVDSLDIGEHLLTEAIDLMLLRNSDIEKISEARDLRLKIGGLAQMTEKNCYRWTRFTKDQLVDLLPRLRLPETFSYRYGDTIYRMPSELAIIIFFYSTCNRRQL